VCGLAFWLPEEGFDPARLYDGHYFASGSASAGYDDYAALEPALRSTFRRRLTRLRERPGAWLLDVGAAYGFAASEAERAGFRVAGLELSAEAAVQAAERISGRVVRASAIELPFSSARFDVITLWDVIEHLPDPHRAVAEIARCLRPGGRLALTTGDVESLVARFSGARWHLYTIPEHLFFFSRRSLQHLLEAHGLHIERMRAQGASYPLGYLVERLRKTLLRRTRAGRRVFPGSDLILRVNLYDVLLVEAVKTTARGASSPA
jgi:SAM-dependent methyltransferase